MGRASPSRRGARAYCRSHSCAGAERGASAAETEISQAIGQSVTVRKGEVETIEYNRDKGIGVTVYLGPHRGHASTADFSADALHAAVDKAIAIARYTAEDPAAGLADPERLAKAWPDLDLYHPWDLDVDARSSSAARPKRRHSPSTGGSPTPRVRASRAANRSSSTPTLWAFSAAIAARAITSTARSSAKRTTRCSATIGIRPRARRTDLMPAAEVGRIAGERTARAARRAPDRDAANARCCSRRRRRPT